MAPKSLPEGLLLVRKIKLENDQLVPSEVCARVAKHLNQAKRSRLRVGTEMDYDVPDRWWHRFEDNEAWLVWLLELGMAIGAVPRTKRKDAQGRPTAESWKTAIKSKLYEEMQREDKEYHEEFARAAAPECCYRHVRCAAAKAVAACFEEPIGDCIGRLALTHRCSNPKCKQGDAGYSHHGCFVVLFPQQADAAGSQEHRCLDCALRKAPTSELKKAIKQRLKEVEEAGEAGDEADLVEAAQASSGDGSGSSGEGGPNPDPNANANPNPNP